MPGSYRLSPHSQASALCTSDALPSQASIYRGPALNRHLIRYLTQIISSTVYSIFGASIIIPHFKEKEVKESENLLRELGEPGLNLGLLGPRGWALSMIVRCLVPFSLHQLDTLLFHATSCYLEVPLALSDEPIFPAPSSPLSHFGMNSPGGPAGRHLTTGPARARTSVDYTLAGVDCCGGVQESWGGESAELRRSLGDPRAGCLGALFQMSLLFFKPQGASPGPPPQVPS